MCFSRATLSNDAPTLAIGHYANPKRDKSETLTFFWTENVGEHGVYRQGESIYQNLTLTIAGGEVPIPERAFMSPCRFVPNALFTL
jgi:hypothetical protein